MTHSTMKKNHWMPIEEFMDATGVSKVEIYRRLKKKEWGNGFVIKKSPCKTSKNAKLKREGKIIRWGNTDHFEEWAGLK